MKKFVETYRGAEIFEDHGVTHSEGEEMGKRLTSTGFVPGSPNLHTDFMEEGATLKAALKKMHASIDQYLKKHSLHHFEAKDH